MHYMIGAWIDRAQRRRDLLAQMVAAPGLFKPEHIDRTTKEYAAAQGWVNYWLLVGGA